QAQQPVMMLLVASLIISFSALADPSGPLAVGASLVPLSAPIIMPVRVATSDVAPTQILMSLAIMAATVVVVVWGAARVYRIGILMKGKRPKRKGLGGGGRKGERPGTGGEGGGRGGLGGAGGKQMFLHVQQPLPRSKLLPPAASSLRTTAACRLPPRQSR